LALENTEIFSSFGFDIDDFEKNEILLRTTPTMDLRDSYENIIKESIKKVVWQCRFEVFSKNPLVIFDGAHNAAGVEELIKIVKQHFSKDEVTVLVSILKDKDRVSMFRKLNEISSSIILTSIPDNPRASTARELYDYVENKKDFEYEEDPIKAYNLALSKKRKLTVCCGSFYILIKLKEGLNG